MYAVYNILFVCLSISMISLILLLSLFDYLA